MPAFKLTIAYDGTDYVGWQRQAAGVSIQGLLEDALSALDEREVAVTGAGRTDAGVHAIGQVASCSLTRDVTAGVVVRAANARLPPDVRIISAEEVPSSFRARIDARSKTYRYRIWNADVSSPFERRYAWHITDRLDVEAMDAAARSLEGTHDFAAFQSAGSDAQTTERKVIASRTANSAPSALITYDVTGTGFLRHMVRAIVGSLVEVGRGQQPPGWIAEVLRSCDRAQAGRTAPPHGLFLVAVEYPTVLAAHR